jgi:alanyl-tRNA synthetase
VASGIRRIEAVAGPSALEFLYERESVVRELTNQLKVTSSELPARVTGTSTRLLCSLVSQARGRVGRLR